MNRRVLQLLPSPIGFRVARYENAGKLIVTPVAMWALVRYTKEATEDGNENWFDRVEPVCFDQNLGMRVCNTEEVEHGLPSDAVILFHQVATMKWLWVDGRAIGLIEIEDDPHLRTSGWAPETLEVEGSPSLKPPGRTA